MSRRTGSFVAEFRDFTGLIYKSFGSGLAFAGAVQSACRGGNFMPDREQVEALRSKHAELEAKIIEEEK
ncbi:MAG: hypothetical protein WD715_01035, partial [Dongiaceae bacterium]